MSDESFTVAAARSSGVARAFVRADASGRDTAWAAVLAFVVVLLAVGAYDLARPKHSLVAGAGGDFVAFYCAGEALDRHENPYVVEPLRGCEHRVQPSPEWSRELVTPAPLPRYALAPFAQLAHLPFGVAKGLWLALLLASICITGFVLARLTRFPLLPVLAALALADGYVELSFGQIPPIVVALVASVGYFAERNAYRTAGALAAATLFEPQLGVPVCVAAFLWWPRARLALAAGALVLGGYEFAASGFHGVLAYLGTVLPDQARSELVASDQFGLSHELYALGVPADAALRAGSLSYVIAVAVGIALGRRAAAALASTSLVAFVPVATSLLGGTYVHDVQFAAAFPAAFVLTARARSWRPAALAALALLIFPWLDVGTVPRAGLVVSALLVATVASVWVAILSLRLSTRRAGVAAVVFIALPYLCLLSIDRRLPAAPSYRTPVIDAADAAPGASASRNWGAYLRGEPSLGAVSPRREGSKVAYWLAIVLLALAASSKRSESRRRAPDDQAPRFAEVPLTTSSRTVVPLK